MIPDGAVNRRSGLERRISKRWVGGDPWSGSYNEHHHGNVSADRRTTGVTKLVGGAYRYVREPHPDRRKNRTKRRLCE